MTTYYNTKKLKTLGCLCLEKAGVQKRIREDVVDNLITTSLRGVDSHGIRLLAHYTRAVLSGRINPKPKFRFTQTMPSVGKLDADDGFGIAAGVEAMHRAIAMAKKTGMGAVSVYNSSHFGAAGIYTIQAARQNMVGYASTHVEAFVPPYNGKKPFLGTNAISFAVPCDGEDPIVLDMATTNMSMNKLHMYKAANKTIPKGWAVDALGNPETDPRLAAFVTHFGEHRGYGMSLMVEIFSSLLSGMHYGPHITPMFPLTGEKRKLGQFFMAINIKGFENPVTFKHRMKQLATELRSIPPRVRGEPVMVAGDPEKHEYEIRKKNGIKIAPADIAAIESVARDLKIPYEKYI